MTDSTPTKSYSSDPTLWLYTSLSSGSSQIVTATSRLETILKANRIPFKALDVATDEKARMLWGRRAGKRKLPGLVKMGMVVGDIDEIEEWNEYGELKEQLGAEVTQSPAPPIAVSKAASTKPAAPQTSTPAAPPMPTAQEISAASKSSTDTPTTTKPASAISFAPEKSKSEMSRSGTSGAQSSMSMTMRQLGQEAAARAKQNKSDSLAARKAQIAAAEKLESSESSETAPLAGNTEPPKNTEAPENIEAPSDRVTETGKHEAVESTKPSSTDETESGSKSEAQSAANDKENPNNSTVSKADETSTTSGTTATRPESPLPASEEASAASKHAADPIIPSLQKSDSAVSNTSIPISVNDLHGPGNEITTHRGSSISAASKEEIKAVEDAWVIPEEPEDIETSVAPESESKLTPLDHDHEQHVPPTVVDETQPTTTSNKDKNEDEAPHAAAAPTSEHTLTSSEGKVPAGDVKAEDKPSTDHSELSEATKSSTTAPVADPELATESVKD